MKSNHPILVLLAGMGGLLLTGCGTPGTPAKKPAAVQPAPEFVQPLVGLDDGLLSEDLADSSVSGAAQVNPEALAHYAAGVSCEWNDEDAKAVQQFYQAALDDPDNERLAIKLARRFLKNKQADKALAVLSNSARRPQASALLLSWFARSELAAGRTNQALATSRAAIRKAPNALDGYECQLEVFFHNNQPFEALRTLNQAAKSVRPDPPSLVALGSLYCLYLKALPDNAAARAGGIAVLDRAAKMNISSSHTRQALADAYQQLGGNKKAVDIYLKLLSDAPEPSPLRESLHEKLAGIYFQTEDRTNAMKQLEAIVRDSPTRYPRAWFLLGELAFADDKLAEAGDDYENALHWDPDIEEAYYKLALVHIALHREDEAFRTVDAARTRFPKTFLGESYTGVVYLQVKNYATAIRHFNTAEVIALATEPDSLDYRFYFQLGEAYERNRQFNQADASLQKCIKLSPDFGEALNYLGYMLADQGEQLPRARTLIAKAIHLEPTNGAYLDSMAWVLFKQHNPRQALPWLLKAVAASPEPDATILDHLGEVYMALHQPAKAVEAWKKSLSIESNPDVKKKLDAVAGGT
jgi:tetratricopeptide (TPR) repeat protein